MKKKHYNRWHYSHWLVHYITLRELRKAFPEFLKGTVLDVGCGEKPYRRDISPFATKYYGIDYPGCLHDTSFVDVFSTADRLPVRDRSVDTVFSAAVLEHLEEPYNAVKEFNRVLKPGGCVIATIPLFWHVHEDPRDFFRYTRYGIEYLFSRAGFTIEMIKPLSGFWVTFGQHLSYMALRYNKGPLAWVPVLPVISLFIQAISLVLDRIDKSERWTWAYLAVGRKNQVHGSVF
jgi:SAM-dependent methyltransferase